MVSQKGVTWRVTCLCPFIMYTKPTQSKKLSVLSSTFQAPATQDSFFPPSLSAWISINHFNRHDGQTEFKLGQNWNRWGRAFKVRAGCKAEWFIDVTVWETVSFLIPENHTLEPSEVKKRWWWSGWQNVTMMDRNPLRRDYLLLNA